MNHHHQRKALSSQTNRQSHGSMDRHVSRQSKGMSKVQHQSKNKKENRAIAKAVTLNKEIDRLAKSRNWEGILQLYEKNRQDFNNVNYSTTMSRLARTIPSNKTCHPKLLALIIDLEELISKRGVRKWLGLWSFSNSVHAIAKMGLKSNDAALSIVRGVDSRAEWLFMNSEQPQTVSNILWACAKLGVQSPKLFAELDDKASWLVQNGNPQEVANTTWACATLGVQSPKLFAELDCNASWLVQNSTPQAAVNTVWACATLGVHSPKLFAELDCNASWFIQNGTLQDVANSVWACATLGVQSPTLFTELHAAVDSLSLKGDVQHLCNLSYALACNDLSKGSNAISLTVLWNALVKCSVHDMVIDNLRQIAFVEVMANSHGIVLSKKSPALEQKLKGIGSVPYSSSPLEMEVSKLLDDFGFDHEREVSPSNAYPGFLSIDFASKERMIAIEFDGPSHFVKNVDFVELSTHDGPTKAKTQLLQNLGWKVVRIDWKDWAQQKKNGNEGVWLRETLLSEGVIDLQTV